MHALLCGSFDDVKVWCGCERTYPRQTHKSGFPLFYFPRLMCDTFKCNPTLQDIYVGLDNLQQPPVV
jgi:hypothetical protein